MLRGLNDNTMRLAVMEWLKNSMDEQPKITEPDQKEITLTSVKSGDIVEDDPVDLPLLEREMKEDGSVTSMTLNFPDVARSVKAPGDAILRALTDLTMWADRLNILNRSDPDESLAARFP